LKAIAPDLEFNNFIWEGRNESKGLGVFSFGDFEIHKDIVRSQSAYIFIPIKLTKPFNLNILAVWAYNHRNPLNDRLTTSKIINSYDDFLDGLNTIVAGDFNDNIIWDNKYLPHQFSNVISELNKLNLISAYHKSSSESFGSESKATFYWQKNPNQPYHIDYIFTSNALIDRVTNLEFGDFDSYKSYSDHIPIIVDFEITKSFSIVKL
jgi:hypothetical protein